jgi:hypothetical protein
MMGRDEEGGDWKWETIDRTTSAEFPPHVITDFAGITVGSPRYRWSIAGNRFVRRVGRRKVDGLRMGGTSELDVPGLVVNTQSPHRFVPFPVPVRAVVHVAYWPASEGGTEPGWVPAALC